MSKSRHSSSCQSLPEWLPSRSGGRNSKLLPVSPHEKILVIWTYINRPPAISIGRPSRMNACSFSLFRFRA